MDHYRFQYPITVRYGDIDAQRHVNNSRYFTYMEQARAHYLIELGLWDGDDFDSIGIILAEQSCRYIAPITLGQAIHVGVRTIRMGTKSIDTVYSFCDSKLGKELATGQATLVAYDYESAASIRIPREWKKAIAEFEGL